jgi:hypothetical protein
MSGRVTNVVNAYETVLTFPMGPEDTTASVESVVGAPQTPCYLVIDPLDPLKREYILFDLTSTATSFSTSSVGNRYLENSAASGGITHNAGAIVRMSPMRQHIDDLNQRIDSRLAVDSLTRDLVEGLGVRHSSLAESDVGDPHTQYLNASRHGSANHEFTLQVTPTNRRMTIGTTPHANPSLNDLWVDTS